MKSEALRKIESLHPERDAWEIIRLSVFYEFPWDFNRSLELALYKTFAVPSISAILAKTQEFELHPQKRYDDTDLMLSTIIEEGIDSKVAGEVIDRLNWIHGNYRISNEDYLYVLSTFIFDSAAWINRYGYRRLTTNEELAGFFVWKQIGERMHIRDIPDNIIAFKKYHDEYEKAHFVFAETNVKVARSTEDLMLGWWLPAFSHEVARPLLHAVMEPHLLKAFGYREPGTLLRSVATSVLRTRSRLERMAPGKLPYIRTQHHTYKTYPNGHSIEALGPDKIMSSSKCPYRRVKEAMAKG